MWYIKLFYLLCYRRRQAEQSKIMVDWTMSKAKSQSLSIYCQCDFIVADGVVFLSWRSRDSHDCCGLYKMTSAD